MIFLTKRYFTFQIIGMSSKPSVLDSELAYFSIWTLIFLRKT